ncbi:MAG TPA: hypothetical protein VH041_07915 [Caldimonas sp.]|jgi:hypothetical protein|nr:hypothetical protein [Caldimonas sp.]HEX4234219.1 hypothetical protein [Caldimonas sp.]
MSVRIDPHAGASSRRLLATLAIAAVTLGGGVALGHHPQAGNASQLAAFAAPRATESVAVPAHDDSVPAADDALSHERVRDDDPTPTF